MQAHADDKVIVYFLTCASVDFFSTALAQLPQMASAKLFALHGKMKQAAREAVMASYTSSTAGTASGYAGVSRLSAVVEICRDFCHCHYTSMCSLQCRVVSVACLLLLTGHNSCTSVAYLLVLTGYLHHMFALQLLLLMRGCGSHCRLAISCTPPLPPSAPICVWA